MKASRLTTATLIALGSAFFGSAPGCSRDQLVAVSDGTRGTSSGTSSSAGGGASATGDSTTEGSTTDVSATGGNTAGSTRTSASSMGGASASTTLQTGGSAQTATGGSSSTSTGCTMNDFACDTGATCCSGNCSRSGLCAPPQGCRTRGQPCDSSSECCSRQCRDRSCEPVLSCHIIGEECLTHDDCCSKTCADPGNGIRTCQALEGCRPFGELCVNGDFPGGCCSGSCKSQTTGGPGFCSENNELGLNCLLPGEACGSLALPCCDLPVRNPDGPSPEPGSAECTLGWAGVSRCRPDPGRCNRPYGFCAFADECCSGNCILSSNSGNGLGCGSGDGTDCAKPGSACRASRDCCVGSACFPRGRDDDLRSINGLCKLTGYSCRQLGQPCGPGEPCCDGLCQGSPSLCVPVRP